VYYTVVQLSRCNGGAITFNQSGITLPRIPPASGGSAAAVPALGDWSLLALGAAALTLGARRLRRRRA
jgi:hypothetical protein